MLPTTQRQKKHWGQNTDYFSPVASVLRHLRDPKNAPDGLQAASQGTHSDSAAPSASSSLDAESLAAHLSHHFNSVTQGLAYVAEPVQSFINFRSTGHSDGTICADDAETTDRKRPRSKPRNLTLRQPNSECPANDNSGKKQVQIVTVPAAFDEESFDLYKRYQVGISVKLLVT